MVTSSPHAADDFFAGKKITIGSYGGAGNNYDAYSRMVARHLGKYIPGHPSFIVVNQPGAGGLMGLNYASRIAPQEERSSHSSATACSCSRQPDARASRTRSPSSSGWARCRARTP
jgi:tripartite-type tricarboxylate transporter receptor subunit TctC